MKRRKPDLLVVLAILIGLGVVATGLSQTADSSQARVSYVSQMTR